MCMVTPSRSLCCQKDCIVRGSLQLWFCLQLYMHTHINAHMPLHAYIMCIHMSFVYTYIHTHTQIHIYIYMMCIRCLMLEYANIIHMHRYTDIHDTRVQIAFHDLCCPSLPVASAWNPEILAEQRCAAAVSIWLCCIRFFYVMLTPMHRIFQCREYIDSTRRRNQCRQSFYLVSTCKQHGRSWYLHWAPSGIEDNGRHL